jgi:serine/threonine protein phosphatase 1
MNRLFAISDIHGCFDTFYDLIVTKIKLEKSDKLVLLGDYIDRGNKSREVIDFIIDLIEKGFNIIPLAGNHESMLVDSFKDSLSLPLWLMNSGESTLESFGLTDVTLIDPRYIRFFNSLQYFYISEKIVFVHAGFNDSAADPFNDIKGMIWECHQSYTNQKLNKFLIIHGHRPKTIDQVLQRINSGSRVIPIDTGCVYGREMGYGYLTALEVGSMKITPVEKI